MTTAQMYNISQTKLDELCHKLNVYPVPDYERFFINHSGALYVISINDNKEVQLIPVTPNKVEENGVCEYSIANMRDEIEHITNAQLCARTFYGYFPEEYMYLEDGKFTGSQSVNFDFGDVNYVNDDIICIRGIYFLRVYYQNKTRTYYFISQNGVLFNENQKRLVPVFFQYNMYLRFQIRVSTGYVRLVGVHRLVYNTWNHVWLDDTIQINHKDGFKYHNNIYNLEEVTQLENIRHAKKTGLKAMPYSEAFIEVLCKLIQENQYDLREIQERMGLPREDYVRFKSLVYDLVHRNAWADITKKYDFTAWKNQKHSRKSERLAHAVCKAYVESGYDSSSVRNQFPDVSRPYLDEICRGAKFPEIAAMYGLPREGIMRKSLTKAQFTELRKMIADGKKNDEIAAHFGVSEDMVRSIILRDERKARIDEEGSTTIESIA